LPPAGPNIGGDAASTPGAIDMLTAGGGSPASGAAPGADQQRAQLAAFMGKLRELDQHIDQVFGEMPALRQVAQQMKAMLKQAVQKAAQTAPAQTASSEAVPGGSQ
jgi:hypothetical protein